LVCLSYNSRRSYDSGGNRYFSQSGSY